MKEEFRSTEGSLFVPLMLVSLAIFSLALWLVDLANISYLRSKLGSISDCVLLSSLRLRAEGLQTVATRWSQVEPLIISGDSNGIQINPEITAWDELKSKLEELKKAIPGYKGRITAVRTLVAKANGIDPPKVSITDGSAFNLGLVNEKQKVWDGTGKEEVLPFVWLSRSWAKGEKLGSPLERSEVESGASFRSVGLWWEGGAPRFWDVKAGSAGGLIWDVPGDEDWVRETGNGGFPRNWDEALLGGAVKPNRFALYWAELRN